MDSLDDTIHISNAIIREIRPNQQAYYVTIQYENPDSCHEEKESLTLIVNEKTTIKDEQYHSLWPRNLVVGMRINTLFSSMMTRSIPPQSQAFYIRVTNRPAKNLTTEARIVQVDLRGHYMITLSNRNLSSAIRFNLTPQTKIYDLFGRPADPQILKPGLRVRIEYAQFMTTSIPPQTTAYQIKIIR